VHVGADEHVLECALALATLAQGRSELRGIAQGAQLTAAIEAWSSLGARCDVQGQSLHVTGAGLHGLTAPRGALDAGESRYLLAHLTAVLCAQSFGTRIVMRSGALREPVDHVVGALRARGGHVAARAGEVGNTGEGGERKQGLFAPVAVAPLTAAEQLQSIDATLPVADRAAKEALLLSGLYARGTTTLSEPLVSFDGMERMLVALGAPLRRIGSVVALSGPDSRSGPDENAAPFSLPGFGTVQLPASAALGAYFAAVVQCLPGSDVTLRAVSINPTHSGVLDVLRAWAGAISYQPLGDAALREPIADVRVLGKDGKDARLRGGVVDAGLAVCTPAAAIAAFVVAAPATQRGVRLCELGARSALPDPELTRLEPLLRAFGCTFVRTRDELWVGPKRQSIEAARSVDAGDHADLALAACSLALACPGETVVKHAARAVRAMYPGFISAARALGADIECS